MRANIFTKIKTLTDWTLNLITLYFVHCILRTIQFIIFHKPSDPNFAKKSKKWFKNVSYNNHILFAVSIVVFLGYFCVSRKGYLEKGVFLSYENRNLNLLTD